MSYLFGAMLRALDSLCKGAGHKYLRRVPTGKVTKTGKVRYRYIYHYTATRSDAKYGHVALFQQEHIVKGTAFRDAAFGHKGHWVVESADRSKGTLGAVVMRHDETGEVLNFDNGWSVRAFIDKGHRDAIRADEERRKGSIATRFSKHAPLALRAMARAHASGDLRDIAKANRSLQWAHRLADFGNVEVSERCKAFGVDAEPKKTAAAHIKEYRALEAECRSLTLGSSDPSALKTGLIDPSQFRRMLRYGALRKIRGYTLARDFGELETSDGDFNPTGVVYVDRRMAEALGSAAPSAAAQKRALEAWFKEALPWRARYMEQQPTVTAALKRGLIVELPYDIATGSADPNDPETKGYHRLVAMAESLPAGLVLGREDTASSARYDATVALSRGLDNAATATDGPTPEAYVDTFKPPPISPAVVFERASSKLSHDRGGESAIDILKANASADPVVSRLVTVGPLTKRAYLNVTAPLSVHTAIVAKEAKSKTDKWREEHQKRYAKAKAAFDSVLGAVDLKKSYRDAVADVFGDRGVRPGNRAVFDLAHEYASHDPSYETASDAEAAKAVADASKLIRDRIQERTLADIAASLGIKGNLAHAEALLHKSSDSHLRKQLEFEALRKKAEAKKVGDVAPDDRMSAYDPSASDPLNMRRLLGFMSPSVAPRAAIHVMPIEVGQKIGKTRAHCSHDNQILLLSNDGPITAWHEYGHAIEHASKGITEAANALRDERGKGAKARPLNETHHSGYDADEIAYEGVPFTVSGPYAAKWYGHGRSTEVLAMGVQHLMHDAAHFHLNDPEHFAFTVAALAGKLGAADNQPGEYKEP